MDSLGFAARLPGDYQDIGSNLDRKAFDLPVGLPLPVQSKVFVFAAAKPTPNHRSRDLICDAGISLQAYISSLNLLFFRCEIFR
jgi:hypothetical protein